MRLLLLLLITFLFISAVSFSQKKEHKKIEKVLGAGFLQTDPEDYYHATYSDKSIAELSTVLINDTTGIYLNGEYLMFHDPLIYIDAQELYKYIRNSPVTVREYEEFMFWVRDSLARERIYEGLVEDEEASAWIDYKDHFFDINTYEYMDFKAHHRSENHQPWGTRFPLNWNKKFYYNDPDYIPLLVDLYLPPAERFYGLKLFDPRKFIYSRLDTINEFPRALMNQEMADRMNQNRAYGYSALKVGDSVMSPRKYFFDSKEEAEHYLSNWKNTPKYWIESSLNIAPKYSVWARNSNHPFDYSSILPEVYSTHFSDKPIVGLKGTQALAFCQWKADQINKKLSSKNRSVRAYVTLPNETDLAKVDDYMKEISFQLNRQNQWKITAAEYQQFIDHVVDSTSREFMYYYLPYMESSKLLLYLDIYFDEGDLEFREFDPSDTYRNRHLFTFDYDRDISKYIDRFCQETNLSSKEEFVKEKLIIDNQLMYKWYYIETGLKSIEGPHLKRDGITQDQANCISDTTITRFEGKEIAVYIGHELAFDPLTNCGTHSGVRMYADSRRFMMDNMTNIIPEGHQWGKTIDVSKITYEQAIAFYCWKYPIYKATSKSNWTNYILPSAEEYQMLQNGTLSGVETIKLALPTPTFRYVVHFYPK